MIRVESLQYGTDGEFPPLSVTTTWLRGIQRGTRTQIQHIEQVPLCSALLQSPDTIGLLQQIGDIMENQ